MVSVRSVTLGVSVACQCELVAASDLVQKSLLRQTARWNTRSVARFAACAERPLRPEGERMRSPHIGTALSYSNRTRLGKLTEERSAEFNALPVDRDSSCVRR
jgi:hypothetical protein